MRGLKSMRLIAVGAAFALIASACAGGGAGDKSKGGGEIKVALADPEHLIPGNTNETQGGTVLQNVYSGLVDYDDDGKPVNLIADSITPSSDQKTWTIKIKKGWTFHNGEPVNADAFINSWNYTAYGPNAQGNSYFFDRIVGYEDLQSVDPDEDGPKKAPKPKTDKLAGLKKTDDYTIEVSLNAPFSSFQMMLGYTAFYPMAEACLKDIKGCEDAPIGDGPFKMVGKWERHRQIKLTAYNKYAGTKPKIKNLTFKIFKNDEAAYSALQSGDIDMQLTIPVDKVETARGVFGDRLIEEPTSTFSYLGFPTYKKEFKNKYLRQAISLAIDRDEIIKKIFAGRFQVAKSVVSPVVPGSRDDACKYCEPDVDKAKELLKKAGGWPKGKKIELWFNAGASHDAWVEAVGHQLKENLGIDFALKGDLEFPAYLEKGDKKGFTGPFRLGWVMDYPSPENYLKPLYGTQGSSNSCGYSNPEFDKLVAEGDAAPTLEEGISKYQAAEDLVLEDMPVIPLWFGKSAMAYNDNVDNVKFDVIDSNPNFSKLTVS
jgi:peptide/nickel transport system substrate-binding protein